MGGGCKTDGEDTDTIAARMPHGTRPPLVASRGGEENVEIKNVCVAGKSERIQCSTYFDAWDGYGTVWYGTG
jgi:hypothetical protein